MQNEVSHDQNRTSSGTGSKRFQTVLNGSKQFRSCDTSFCTSKCRFTRIWPLNPGGPVLEPAEGHGTAEGHGMSLLYWTKVKLSYGDQSTFDHMQGPFGLGPLYLKLFICFSVWSIYILDISILYWIRGSRSEPEGGRRPHSGEYVTNIISKLVTLKMRGEYSSFVHIRGSLRTNGL